MSKNIQAIRGMHDLLPDQSPLWQFLERQVRSVVAAYGYREIRTPIVEKTELFKRSIGEVTDIVEKEMYTFEDRNGDSLTLRPECTASCVRAGIEHGLLFNQQQRLWYIGPMFRHERPQKGRYRQFHQVGVETFGMPGPDIDVELILMSARIWQALGLENLRLELNTLGTADERARYRSKLVDYLRQHHGRLDEDSKRRLDTNPLRILDSKNPDMQALLVDAPALMDDLGAESRAHFDGLKALLDAVGVSYTVNPRLVRGLDYYCHTVFEWITEQLGAQGTVCAGGRYDGLVEQLGGKPTVAAGFALGIERLVALMEESGTTALDASPHVYVAMSGSEAERYGMLLAERLRNELPELRLLLNCGGGSFKAQMKRADRSGAQMALVIGAQEVAEGVVGVKQLRAEAGQESIEAPALAAYLCQALALGAVNDFSREQ